MIDSSDISQHSRRSYDAIIFDMDGVLVDTQEWVVCAFQHTSQHHDLAIEDAALADVFGQPLEVCYELLAPDQNSALFVTTHRTFQLRNMHLIRPFDGIRDVLIAVRDAGYRIGMVTGRTHASADLTLTELGLREFFEAIMGADDTERHKPDPQPLSTLLDRWGIAPERALMIGDAPADILCGQGAGCDTAAALYGFVGSALLDLHPNHVFQKPSDLLELLK